MIEQDALAKTDTKSSTTVANRINDRMARSTFSSKAHRLVYRLSRGRLGGKVKGVGVLLLTTQGRRSNKQRTVPLMYLQDGDRFLVVASNAAEPDRAPAWWLNLQAEPEGRVQMQSTSHAVRAADLEPDQRDAAWPRLAIHNPNWERFQQETTRRFPVVALQLDPKNHGPA